MLEPSVILVLETADQRKSKEMKAGVLQVYI